MSTSSNLCAGIIAKMMKNWMQKWRRSRRIMRDCALFYCNDSIAGWWIQGRGSNFLYPDKAQNAIMLFPLGILYRLWILKLCVYVIWDHGDVLPESLWRWRPPQRDTCRLVCSNQCLAVLITSVSCQALKLASIREQILLHSLILETINIRSFF